MKSTRSISMIILLTILAGCGGKKQLTDELITVDVNASYPEKELILQDFMDVEYIALETTDDFITQGAVMAIGDEIILVKNWINDGNIFVFDRKNGKGLRKINRKGQSGEEYAFMNGIVLDEKNNEMFVNDATSKRILVYDLYGEFKRSFGHIEDTKYLDLFHYDKDNLICYNISGYYKNGEERGDQLYHAIISKQDGSVVRHIPIPFKEIKAPTILEGDGVAMSTVRPIIPNGGNWLLVETSSDTIYNYVAKKNKLNPAIVRTPSIHSMDPVVFLTMGSLTDRYYFMKTVKRIFDFKTGRGFPTADLMYDKEENAIFTFAIFNGDYTTKQKVDMASQPVNDKIVTFQNLVAHRLLEAYEKDQLTGKLKEIASKLDEESNPVIMLIKHKK